VAPADHSGASRPGGGAQAAAVWHGIDGGLEGNNDSDFVLQGGCWAWFI
jgi:hypothetical protein